MKLLNSPVAETHFVEAFDGTAQTITDRLKAILQEVAISGTVE